MKLGLRSGPYIRLDKRGALESYNVLQCSILVYTFMKTPEQCEHMQDIRCEVDQIDRDIIRLLGQRYSYVKAAAKFKRSVDSVKARDRVSAMLQQRRLWAEEFGLSADMVEKVYTDLVNYFIHEEMERWKQEHE